MPSNKPRERVPCAFEGCDATVRSDSGFCAVHVHVAYPCAIRECPNRVAAHSRSRCCSEHRIEGVRRLRKGVKPWEV